MKKNDPYYHAFWNWGGWDWLQWPFALLLLIIIIWIILIKATKKQPEKYFSGYIKNVIHKIK